MRTMGPPATVRSRKSLRLMQKCGECAIKQDESSPMLDDSFGRGWILSIAQEPINAVLRIALQLRVRLAMEASLLMSSMPSIVPAPLIFDFISLSSHWDLRPPR